MTSAPAIGFEYRCSPLLDAAVASMALFSLLAIALCGLPASGKLALATGLLVALAITWRRRPATPVSVGWNPAAGWSLRLADGGDVAAELASHRVLAGCIVLCLKSDRTRWALWLLPDNSDADTRRRLRMRLAAKPAGSAASVLR
jgi:toxin CptA